MTPFLLHPARLYRQELFKLPLLNWAVAAEHINGMVDSDDFFDGDGRTHGGYYRARSLGPICMKCYKIKLVIIMHNISEHMVAVGTVKNAFKLVKQLVSQKRSLS